MSYLFVVKAGGGQKKFFNVIRTWIIDATDAIACRQKITDHDAKHPDEPMLKPHWQVQIEPLELTNGVCEV